MDRPYIICHMMASLDGRIDCDMTAQIGSEGYYQALIALNVDTTIEGRVTALMHYAEKQVFIPKDSTPVGKEEFFRSSLEGNSWEAVADSQGTLLWPEDDIPHRLCIVSCRASREYLDYLRDRGISYIATGKDRVDLKRASEILFSEFGAGRIGVVGGGHLNGGFLKAGLLDEVSMVYGAAIDGREGFPAAFDGIEAGHVHPYMLRLLDVRRMPDDSVWLRYSTRA